MKKSIEEMSHEERMKQYLPFARYVAHKYASALRHSHDQEDIVSVVLESIWESSKTWQPELGSSFGAYIKQRAIWTMHKLVKNINRPSREVAWHTLSYDGMRTHPDSAELGIEFPDVDQESADDKLVREAETALLLDTLDCLDPKYRRILYGRFVEEKKLVELGEEFGVSRERIRQLEVIALEQLRHRLRVSMPKLRRTGT